MVDAGMYALAHYKPLVPEPLRERISKDLRSKFQDSNFDFGEALSQLNIR